VQTVYRLTAGPGAALTLQAFQRVLLDAKRSWCRSGRNNSVEVAAAALPSSAAPYVLAGAPNVLIFEHMDWGQPLFTEPLRLEEGCVVLSENPGIRFDLDRKALERFNA
jgi:L-alanine-DL-glutamate epimerase-like enolase superfamily enzyme